MPLNLDFSGGVQEIQIDLVLEQFLAVIEMIQGVFIGNQDSAQPFEMEVQGSSQLIVLGKNKQGFFPLFVPNPPKIICRSTGGVVIPLVLYNVPVGASVWDAV